MSDTAHDVKRIGVRADDLAAIRQLCARYFDLADHDDGPNAATLFHDQGTLQLGALRIEGKAAIAGFFDDRAAQNRATGRVVRHLAAAPFVTFGGEDTASTRSTIAVFAGAGPLPLQSAPPSTVFDFVDEIVRSSDGEWRFTSRRADVLFTGEGAASFARPTPPSGEE